MDTKQDWTDYAGRNNDICIVWFRSPIQMWRAEIMNIKTATMWFCLQSIHRFTDNQSAIRYLGRVNTLSNIVQESWLSLEKIHSTFNN